MSIQQTIHARNQTYQTSLSNDLYNQSYYRTPKRLSNDDEQIVKGDFTLDIKSPAKRRSTSSTSSISSFKMQQPAAATPTSDETNIGVPSRNCSVCGDMSTGIHFGGNSCESCKAFFRRSVQCNRYRNYKCSNDARCPVNIVTRKVCQFCRYTKCTTIGMKPKWVLSDQEREEKYGSRRKRFRENRTIDEDPDIYKYLSNEEKLLIEDIAHAFYQSRATYPLSFPPQLNAYLSALSSGIAPPTPPSSTTEKPTSPSTDLLIVPIQRLVLFARMLKDFDQFSEDDKVSLLKGSAIEILVCSSNTLFNPKTHAFTNYLSRDQRAVMDDQIMPLDPLLIKLWGEELFHRTKNFLISMCKLQVDEVTSTLLVPVILFSPDRSNTVDLALVKSLQVKYVALLQKYMNWRYGVEATESIYPKLLLQIVNIRTLSLAHAEIIQKVMATSSVNPLVQEVTAKPEIFCKTTSDGMESLSISSTPMDGEMLEYDKIPSVDMESNIGSDEDDNSQKKSRTSIDDDADDDNDDSNETNPRNIWKKHRKITGIMQTEITNMGEPNLSATLKDSPSSMKHDLARSSSVDYEKFSNPNYSIKRPHDHQVPNFVPKGHDDLTMSSRTNSVRHLPPKKQSMINNQDIASEQIHRSHSKPSNDSSPFDQHSQSGHLSMMSPPLPQQYYPPTNTFDGYQHFNGIPPSNFQQQQNEQHLFLLSLANNNPNATLAAQSPAPTFQPHPGSTLDPDEQQLLDAIHAHPNKRDLVLNLLRQMNESSLPPSTVDANSHMNYHGQQSNRTETSTFPNPSRPHTNVDHYNNAF